MVGFLDWKFLSKTQILSLEEENDPDHIKSKLEEYMNISYKDLTMLFCKDQAFDGRRTSTFMSIMFETFTVDMAASSPAHSRTYSFKKFEMLLLAHSIERSPVSIQVFNESDVAVIMKYAIDSYYRQYNLYKYVFSSKSRLVLTQGLPQDVEAPSLAILPLNNAFEFHVFVPNVGGSGDGSEIGRSESAEQ